MSAARWQETGVVAPPEGIVVLGWWGPLVFGAVVRRNSRQWFEPGYLFAEACTPPKYWTHLSSPPDAKAE